ncbi:MAG TPA: hypothetical protein VFA20_00310 [Myxococcaceae bacterium]|nr:hypothetical protein [Myxococcaceae bacterium]
MASSTPSASARFKVLIDSLFDQFGRAFQEAGWSVQREPVGGPEGYVADFVLERKPHRYVAELRVAREARRPELPALLADAYVRAQAGARAHGAKPLAVVGAPAISDEWSAFLADHAARFFGKAAWGIIDGRGRLELHGPGLEGFRRRPRTLPLTPSRQPPDVFSDRGQWMSKILLAPDLPEHLLEAPRGPVSGPSDLAELAEVSVPSASRFLSRLEELRYLNRSNGVTLVRRERYLADWRRASRFVGVERSCRWRGPSRRPFAEVLLEHAEAGFRACFGLFAACERLGLGFVRGAPVHLYVDDSSDLVLERLGLAPASKGERVDLFVREPMFFESIFRGAVERDGVPVADVLQCWLDVADHPVRGAEQAERIWKRVLQPQLIERWA